LIRLLYRQGWARQQVLELFAVLDWMMRLPPHLKQRLWQDVDALDEEKRMAFVNTWEERGIEKGIAKGIEAGIAKGIEKGITLGEAALLERLLTRRFGPLSDDAQALLASATSAQLQTWGDRVLDAATLAEVFGGH
jgi:flagellar biosynthesis/type III secretory pathway protein FliH